VNGPPGSNRWTWSTPSQARTLPARAAPPIVLFAAARSRERGFRGGSVRPCRCVRGMNSPTEPDESLSMQSVDGMGDRIVAEAGRIAAATSAWLLLVAEFDRGRATPAMAWPRPRNG